ncbi:fibroleukin-like [Saccostrea echinata]|uniref:fibroleukin-like n=1 Tax=Saccostrea echinata TaxID=191078 RepID=UPI002A817664|nr:fibroleukin-like [Saccostrea echinata]
MRERSSQSLIECGLKCLRECPCSFYGYNPSLKKCRVHRRTFTSGMSEETGWRYYSPHHLPVDCKDLRNDGHTNTGVFEIYPFGNGSCPVRVYCDMDTMNGGWTAIQKRVDGSLTFEQNWTDYKNGFGAPERNVWIGNDVIHQLTKGNNSSLYVSITLVNGTTLYELYNRFSVSDEAGKYRLFLAGPATGTLEDRMLNSLSSSADLSGMSFSTQDRDNDGWSTGSCASKWRGGWWMNACYDAFLNGPWAVEDWDEPWNPIMYGTSITGTMMLIKRL